MKPIPLFSGLLTLAVLSVLLVGCFGKPPIVIGPPPGADDIQHMMLVYTHTNWTLSQALPLVAYSPRDEANPTAETELEDWFFDTVLFLAQYTLDRQYGFQHDDLAPPAKWEHWQWFLDYLFQPYTQIEAFNNAVQRAKATIDDPMHKVKVAIMVPYPMTSQTDFGDPMETGKSLSFAAVPQGRTAQKEARLTAVQAYIDDLYERWQAHDFEHLELVGLYWMSERINSRDNDMALIQDVAQIVRGYDLQFFWIPYYNAPGWNQWKEAGFDFAILQPNYMFHDNVPLSRFREAAERAQRYGMGWEMEMDGTVLTSAARRQRYLAYLAAGVQYGFMNNAIHGYFQSVDVLLNAYRSNDGDVRRLYDATYEYVKGVYDPKSD